jgi:hypothetical protein
MKPARDGTPGLKALQKRLKGLREQQERLVPVWRQISEYVAPNRGAFDNDEPNQGRRRDRKLIDSTPPRSLGVLQSGMQGGLTSPSMTWFKLQVSDPELAALPSVMLWTDEVRDRMAAVLAQSNIYNCLHGIYGEIAAFGIGALMLEDDDEDIIRGKLMTAGEYFVGFNAGQKIDAFGRTFRMTAGQMRGRFGEDRLSEHARGAAERGRPEEWFIVNHIIVTDENHDTPMPYLSVYWEEGQERELEAAGYEEFPVLCPRWETIGSDFYGYGPGWLALSESKALQQMWYDMLAAQELLINPPVFAPEMAKNAEVDIRPGRVNYLTSPTPIQPVFQVRPDTQGQMAVIENSRQMINQIFYSDLFLMIAQLEMGKMTATEAQIRKEERMQMLGPVIERLEYELLNPLIGRTFGIMNRLGMFPQPPKEMEGRRMTIEYVSMLALAQKSSGLSEIGNLLAMMGQVAQMSPEVVDKLDADELIDQYVRLTNIPSALVRTDEETAALRQARAEQQRQAQEMMAMQAQAASMKQGASAAKDLATAPVQEGTVMDALMKGGV